MKYIALDMDFFSGNNCMLALEKEASRFTEDQISVIMLTKKTRSSISETVFQSGGMEYLVSDNGAEIRNVSRDQIMYRNYLSRETTRVLNRLLYKTKTVPQIQVNGKLFMERKDYKKMQNSAEKADLLLEEQINPVYGAVQLLHLFEEKIERIRITSESSSRVSELYSQLKKALPIAADKIIFHRNEIEIIPRGNDKANALEIIKSQLHINSQDLIPVPRGMMAAGTQYV